eukprot:Skav223978  [mRNA]  locus=scaffold1107:305609:305887:- [translate_table: standard]
MTRNRYHYVGLYTPRVADAPEQIAELSRVWQDLMDRPYPSIPLEYFLCPSSVPGAKDGNDSGKNSADRKWKQQHKDIFEQYQASTGERCHES